VAVRLCCLVPRCCPDGAAHHRAHGTTRDETDGVARRRTNGGSPLRLVHVVPSRTTDNHPDGCDAGPQLPDATAVHETSVTWPESHKTIPNHPRRFYRRNADPSIGQRRSRRTGCVLRDRSVDTLRRFVAKIAFV